MANQLSDYLTREEAAEAIGVAPATVSRYVSNEQLPAVRIGRMVLIPRKSLKKFKRRPVGNPNFKKKTE